MRCAVLFVLLAAVAAAAHAAAQAGGQPAHFAQEKRIAARMLHEGGERRSRAANERPWGPPAPAAGMHAPGGVHPVGGQIISPPGTPPLASYPPADGKRVMAGAPAPAGAPQGGKGQQEGGAKQGGGKQGGGGGGKGNSAPKIAASLSRWTDDTLSNDGWLMMSFVVALFAGAQACMGPQFVRGMRHLVCGSSHPVRHALCAVLCMPPCEPSGPAPMQQTPSPLWQ